LITGTDAQRAASAGALLKVADGDDVAVIFQHVERVFDRLLVEVARPSHLRVGEADDAPAQTVHRRLGGQPRARARLIEGGDQRLLLQQVAVAPVPRIRLQVLAHLEDPEVLHPLEVLERENVPTEKAPHPRCLLVSVPFNAALP